MSTATKAGRDARGSFSPLAAAEFAADFPDHELVVYRNHVTNVECLIQIPKARIKPGHEPLFRHGAVIEVKPDSGRRGVRPILRSEIGVPRGKD